MKRRSFVIFLCCLTLIAGAVHAQEASPSEREAMYYRYLEFASYVKGGSIEPHWMADGSSFWYAEGGPENTVIYKVDPKANTKTPLFDTARLRQALTPLLGEEPPYQGLPFEAFAFVDDSEQAVEFTVEDKAFILQLDPYKITRAPVLSEAEKGRLIPQIVWRVFPRSAPDFMEVLSPDGRWFAGLKEYNLWLRSTDDGRSVQLTTDGIEDYKWGGYDARPWARWSPDSSKLALTKVDWRGVSKIPVVHWLNPVVEVDWENYRPVGLRAGERTYQTEIFIVDILAKRQVRVDTGQEPDQRIYIVGWQPDGSELLFLSLNRDFKKVDLMAADPATGSSRVVLTETDKTYLNLSYILASVSPLLDDGERFIWMSERDGWNHLYLYDLDGNLIRRLTEGEFPVIRVIAVDEQTGWVYFLAYSDRQRSLDRHLYRVNLEGDNFTQLTEATGWHASQFSPSKEFFLDTHSSVARAPVVELRRADGELLQTLSLARSVVEERAHSLLPWLALTATLMVLSAALILVTSKVSLVAGFVALFLTIVGTALLVPLIVNIMTPVLSMSAGIIFGLTGRLAVRGISRSLSRTGVAIAALTIAVAAIVGMSVMVGSFRGSVEDWLGNTLRSDIYVTAPGPGGNRAERRIDPALVKRLVRVQGVSHYSASRRVWIETGSGPTRLQAVQMAPESYVGFEFLGGDPGSIWPAFDAGEGVLISDPYAYRQDLRRGDSLTLPTIHGERDFAVLAIYRDYNSDQGVVTLSRAAYVKYWQDEAITSLGIYLEPDADNGTVIDALTRTAAGLQALLVRSNQEIREWSLRIFDRTFVITDVLYWLAMIVAFVGVLGAVLALSLERGKELAILRALGMTRAQVASLVAIQCGTMGLLAGLLALPVGMLSGWLLIHVINRRAFGWQIDMTVPGDTLVAALTIAILTALLASLYPAWRVTRWAPAATLREE